MDKGPFAWDRKGRFWNRVAIGGKLVEAPVTDVSLKEGKLRVTVKKEGQEGQEGRAFEYSVDALEWRELR